MKESNVQELIDDYLGGMKYDDLCKKYHHKFATIKQILVSNNIPLRTKSDALKGKNNRNLTAEEEQLILDNYCNKLYGIKKSGAEIGASEPVVKKVLKKHNIKIRNHYESMEILGKNNRKYNINDNFFSTETADMAYIMGFIAADGTVRKDSNEVKITLARKDKELLEKFVDKLETNYPIKDTTTAKGYDISTLCFSSKQIKQDLAKYGIVPQKTFTFNFPTNLSKQYWIDFIRGYFDGDGTICLTNNYPRFSICSARKETLQTIIDYFEELGIPSVNIYTQMKEKPLYYFQYSTNAVKSIYKLLYPTNCLKLQRKFNTYTSIMK